MAGGPVPILDSKDLRKVLLAFIAAVAAILAAVFAVQGGDTNRCSQSVCGRGNQVGNPYPSAPPPPGSAASTPVPTGGQR